MSCLFCDCKESFSTRYPVYHFNRRVFRYKRCKECGLSYLDPLPEADDYSAMYPPSYQSHEADTTILQDPDKKLAGLRFSYSYHFNLIRQLAGSAARILDYGCGNGNFIANAEQQGFTCAGSEYNESYLLILANSMKSLDFYPINALLEGVPGLQFDVIRLSNVLEHLSDPRGVIQTLKQYLKPGGIFLVEGPVEENFCLAGMVRNFYFRLKKITKRNWSVTAPPYHIFMSDRKNQRRFFVDCGLKEFHFKVKEDAWPFPENFSSAKGMSQKVNAVIARISKRCSKVFNRNAGNTFIYAGGVQ